MGSLAHITDEYALSSLQQAMISTFGTLFFVANFFLWKSYTEARVKDLPKEKLYEISNLVVSCIQAALASVMALTVIISNYDDLVHKQHPFVNVYTAFSMPYFAYDLWSMYYVYVRKEGAHISNFFEKMKKFLRINWLMIVHHAVIGTMGTLVILNWRHGVGDTIVAFFFLHELSTPFVSLRQILIVLNMKDSKLYSINGIVMIVMFFLCRIAVYPFMFYLYSRQEKIDIAQSVVKLPGICTFCSILVILPQLYWFALMIRGAVKHFILTPRVKKTKINNNKAD